jgi:hypothetical protein
MQQDLLLLQDLEEHCQEQEMQPDLLLLQEPLTLQLVVVQGRLF